QLRARFLVVPAAHRSAHRRLYRVYGARKYCWSRHRAAALDDGLWLRDGARVRFFVRATAISAIRRVSPSYVAAFVQHWRRTGPASRPDSAHSRAAAFFPLRCRRAHGNYHPLRDCGAHGLALDAGPRSAAAAILIRMARAGCGVAGPGASLAGAVHDSGRAALAYSNGVSEVGRAIGSGREPGGCPGYSYGKGVS